MNKASELNSGQNYLFGNSFWEDPERLTEDDRARRFESFLFYLRDGNTQAYARRRAGLSEGQITRRRTNSTDFAGQMDAAIAEGSGMLEQEAIRRAVQGVKEPVYYKGDVVGHVEKRSDSLLMFLLKARDPRYRESRQVVESTSHTTVSPGAPAFDPTKLTDDQLIQLEELLSVGAVNG